MKNSETAAAVREVFAGSPFAPSAEQAALLGDYLELLLRWSRKINLTGFKGARAAAEGLLYDACQVEPLLGDGQTVLDVGAGAGGLAVTLMVIRGDLRLIAAEPRTKRAVFIRRAARELSLTERMTVHSARAEELEAEVTDSLNAAYAQAVLPPKEWVELGRAFLPEGARLICLTARPLEDLLELSPGDVLVGERRYSLPFSQTPRVVSVLKLERRSV